MAVISVVPKKVLNLKQPRSAKMQEVTQMQRRSASAYFCVLSLAKEVYL